MARRLSARQWTRRDTTMPFHGNQEKTRGRSGRTDPALKYPRSNSRAPRRESTRGRQWYPTTNAYMVGPSGRKSTNVLDDGGYPETGRSRRRRDRRKRGSRLGDRSRPGRSGRPCGDGRPGSGQGVERRGRHSPVDPGRLARARRPGPRVPGVRGRRRDCYLDASRRRRHSRQQCGRHGASISSYHRRVRNAVRR